MDKFSPTEQFKMIAFGMTVGLLLWAVAIYLVLAWQPL